MRLQFRPGARLESDQPVVGQHAPAYDDAWKTATPLPLDGVDSKTYEATSYVWHYNDVDWLSIRPRVDGTLSWSADVLAAEDHDESTFNILMRARILRVVGNDIEQLDGTSAGDSPNCPHRSSFVEGLEAGERYLVRISALEASPTHPYTLRFEYTPGGPEDAQPGGVGAVDDAATAHDLGTATDAAALSAETWFWQPFDRDWFRFRTPSTPGEVEIVLDFTASHEALGYRSSHNESCGQNPHGIGAWLYLFDQAWFETAEQEFSEHLTRATEGDVPTQTIVWPVEADRDYYVLTSSRHNADRSNAYSVSVRFTPTAPVE